MPFLLLLQIGRQQRTRQMAVEQPGIFDRVVGSARCTRDLPEGLIAPLTRGRRQTECIESDPMSLGHDGRAFHSGVKVLDTSTRIDIAGSARVGHEKDDSPTSLPVELTSGLEQRPRRTLHSRRENGLAVTSSLETLSDNGLEFLNVFGEPCPHLRITIGYEQLTSPDGPFDRGPGKGDDREANFATFGTPQK